MKKELNSPIGNYCKTAKLIDLKTARKKKCRKKWLKFVIFFEKFIDPDKSTEYTKKKEAFSRSSRVSTSSTSAQRVLQIIAWQTLFDKLCVNPSFWKDSIMSKATANKEVTRSQHRRATAGKKLKVIENQKA